METRNDLEYANSQPNENEKKYKLKKKRFVDWLFSDSDDIQYWGARLIKELKSEGEFNITLQDMFDERDEIPIHILENYHEFNERQVDDWVDEVDASDVELVD